MVVTVAQQPCFADGAITGQRRGEEIGQTTAAPEPILIDWFEARDTEVLDSAFVLLSSHSHPFHRGIIIATACSAFLAHTDSTRTAAPSNRPARRSARA